MKPRSTCSLRTALSLAAALAVWTAAATPAAGEEVGATDCVVEPFDGTSENAYGVNPGFVAEWCSGVAQPPPECRAGNYYYGNVEAYMSRQVAGSPTMSFQVQFRAGDGSAAPGDPVLGANVYASSVAVYPSSTRAVGVSVNLTPLSTAAPVIPCVQLDGNNNPSQFLTVDRSAGTTAVPCWAGNPPTINENCTSFDATMRALRVARAAGRFGGPCNGGQVVPPDPTNLRCGFRGWSQGGTQYGLEIFHDLTNVIDVGLNLGSPGVDGPRLLTLPPPFTSPMVYNNLDLAFMLVALESGKIYLEILASAAQVRGQLLPANQVGQCDFEAFDIASCLFIESP